ncbi:branched-chain amino acid transport system permease protein [Kibdelosporangium banguiense]|uniref:Branched-chain amino acid transport system permease protein n=1 Tax=Kibdelosporangium banguiense TaxID=1365924 RepID=A0ABS4U0W2_9PSEU|nr:branched-chain amino acid ABC transporter ATP-binding protein/permease [Kibdelosporangium banguiense]MBP2330287.1 branched-chain amino acid transport system permease protein [Kibdelosporangium banguiense]
MNPRVGHGIAAVVCLALILVPLIDPAATYEQTVLLLAFLVAIQSISWNIISGFAGYISLGHSVFLGIGAYTAGILSTRWEVNPLVLAPLSGVVAVVVALLVGSVVLRVKGPAFVIITIALLLLFQILAVNLPGLTNGSDGITLELPFWDPEIQNIPFYYMFLGLMVLAFGFSVWIRRTKFGTGLVAIREDEGKAAAIGIPATLYKNLAYAASSFFVGVAGAVYAYFLTFLNPLGAFNILVSVTVVLGALAGGRGTLWGPVIGAFIVSFASEAATVYGGGSQSRLLLFGLALVIIVLFMPAGLLPALQRLLPKRPIEYTDHVGAMEHRPIEVTTRPIEDKTGPLLEIRDVHKAFGGLHAVNGASLEIPRGSITALIGPNGSGKTTLFNLITGTGGAHTGQIWFDGSRIDGLAPWTRAHRGLGRTFQVTRLFKSMTVLENVVSPLGSFSPSVLASGAVSGHEADRARDLLSFVGLGRFENERAGALSYGQQKLVELAQVLMLEPRLVLLDEPAGGVNPGLVDRMADVIRAANRQGITFLVVEHNIPMVLDLCDPVFVLARGEVIASGPPDVIRNDAAVLDAYLGEVPT